MQRILTAAVLAPLFYGTVAWGSPEAFAALAALAAVLGVLEVATLAERCGGRVHPWLAAALGAGACVVSLDPERAAPRLLALTIAVCGGALAQAVARPDGGCSAFGSAAATLFAGFYPGVLVSFMVALRAQGEERGRDLVFFVAVAIWASDTAAYYLGRAFGRHLLCPRVSPKKTVEGAIGGVVAAALAAEACRRLFFPEIGAPAWAVGAALALVGIVGDLAESVLKRGAGVKDTATLLPGHGGVLDRIDSILLAGPAFYYYYQWAMT